MRGRLTTPTSLIAGSGMSYGTANRAISDMVDRGLIARRPRTRTGKSFSLHPSAEMMAQWQDYARRIKSIVGGAFGMSARGDGNGDYFFGGSYMSARIIPPPAALAEKLPLASPLRILVHADPTFMAMHALKKQFETILGVGIESRALSIDRLRGEAITNSDRPVSRYDIVAADLPWFGEFAYQGVLLAARRPDGRDPFQFLRLPSRRGRQHPACRAAVRASRSRTTPELLQYRTDLFEEAGIGPADHHRRGDRTPRAGSPAGIRAFAASPGTVPAARRSATPSSW